MNNNLQPYLISSEQNVTELLSHFDAEYILAVLEDELKSINIASSIIKPNIVSSFEETFKLMREQFPGDESNIIGIRDNIYSNIIEILCNKFNLQYNYNDETIDKYTAAYYIYDFLVCNRNSIMINFFTSFIINNKNNIPVELKKTKDSSTIYNKKIYTDPKLIAISANMESVIKYISELDIKLYNIFSSTYTNQEIVLFLDNAFADRGNFFKTYYCNISVEDMPIVITNIRLQLQNIAGNISSENIQNILWGN